MAEGDLPKVNGDILYASEVNRFAGAPQFLFIGSTINVGSQTALQNAGSLVIGAGSLSNPAHINMYGSWNVNSAQVTNFRLHISGINRNVTYTMPGSNANAQTLDYFTFDGIIGSPIGGRGMMIGYTSATNGQSPMFIADTGNLSNFFVGSPVVIFFQFNAAAANTRVDAVSVQLFRSAV